MPDIIEAALNHVNIRSPQPTTAGTRYRPQVAAALQRMADMLEGIEAGAGQIVPLRRACGRARRGKSGAGVCLEPRQLGTEWLVPSPDVE